MEPPSAKLGETMKVTFEFEGEPEDVVKEFLEWARLIAPVLPPAILDMMREAKKD